MKNKIKWQEKQQIGTAIDRKHIYTLSKNNLSLHVKTTKICKLACGNIWIYVCMCASHTEKNVGLD